MNDAKLKIVGCLAGLAGVLLTSSAFAQAADAPAATAPSSPPEPAASRNGSAQVGMTLPGANPQAAAVAGTSDHDAVVGRLAVGYMGRTVAFAGLAGANAIPVPVIGVRYWLSDMLGIDAGLGFGIGSASAKDGMGNSTDAPSYHAFMLHGGVPLSLASAGHFSFQVIPELNLGFAGSSVTDAMGNDTSLSAFHLDIGARAGAEIHFGFINVPQLSLQGSIGARMNIDSTSNDPGDAGASAFSFATTVGDNPWNIFTSNVAALYYF